MESVKKRVRKTVDYTGKTMNKGIDPLHYHLYPKHIRSELENKDKEASLKPPISDVSNIASSKSAHKPKSKSKAPPSRKSMPAPRSSKENDAVSPNSEQDGKSEPEKPIAVARVPPSIPAKEPVAAQAAVPVNAESNAQSNAKPAGAGNAKSDAVPEPQPRAAVPIDEQKASEPAATANNAATPPATSAMDTGQDKKESKTSTKKRSRGAKQTGATEDEASPPKRQKHSKPSSKASSNANTNSDAGSGKDREKSGDAKAGASSKRSNSGSKMLTDLEAQETMNGLMAQKDAAYEKLMGKYRALKDEKKDKHEALVKKVTHNISEEKKAADKMIALLTAERDALAAQLKATAKTPNTVRHESKMKEEEAQEKQAMQEQLKTLQEKVTSLEAQVGEQQTSLTSVTAQRDDQAKQIECYQLLTATKVTQVANKPGVVRCTMVNRAATRRVIEFDLATEMEDGDEVSYTPRKIDLAGADYPVWMKDSISFEPEFTPLLMKNVLEVVHKRTEAAAPAGAPSA